MATQTSAHVGLRTSALVFILVLLAQLALVAMAGTDIPFHDQWDVEGRWLYPGWREGTLAMADFLRPHNEHRILWTHLLNLSLFVINGQWDPMVQLCAIAALRAACAAGLVWPVARYAPGRAGIAVAAVAVTAFLPHLAWHSVLWGFESQIYFALGFSLLALALLYREDLTTGCAVFGLLAGIAALFAMASAALVPVALLGLVAIRLLERRRMDRALLLQSVTSMLLLMIALLLRVHVPAHAELNASNVSQFTRVADRVLGWPHVNVSFAALAMNAPLAILAATRLLRWRVPRSGEDFVVVVGGWSAANSLATAWARGGSWELVRDVPSRYVDFVVLLPLANIWAACVLAREAAARWKTSARVLTGAWGLFVLVGWLGLSGMVLRTIVLPRVQDREAPIRLLKDYQATGNASVYENHLRLLVPHPNLNSVGSVLADPRLEGSLPPSLQPTKPMGPLSTAARVLHGHR